MRGLRFLLIEMRKKNILITSFMIWLYQDAFCPGYTQQVCLENLLSTCQIYFCLSKVICSSGSYIDFWKDPFAHTKFLIWNLVKDRWSFWINHTVLSGSNESTFRNGTFRFSCYLDIFQIAYCSCTQIQSLFQSFGNFKEGLQPWFALSMSVW